MWPARQKTSWPTYQAVKECCNFMIHPAIAKLELKPDIFENIEFSVG